MAALETLAPELLVLIQCMVDSPRDLHSLISASPTCFRSFCLNRRKILLSVAVNGILPGALRHAVAICHVPPPVVSCSRQRKRRRRRRNHNMPSNPLEIFLDKYFSEDAFDFPINISDITTLLSVQALVSRFADEYFVRATGLLRTTKTPAPQDSERPDEEVAPPSLSELTRLHRAFFRYELYSRAFYLPYDLFSDTVPYSGADQFNLFIARLEPWEAEEMSCVNSFLMHLAGRTVEDLEDRTVQAVLTSPGVLMPPDSQGSRSKRRPPAEVSPQCNVREATSCEAPSQPLSQADTTSTGGGSVDGRKGPAGRRERMVAFDDLESWGLKLFERFSRRSLPSHVSNLAAPGLEYVRRLIDGDDEQRRTMIQLDMAYHRDFLGDALRHSPLRDRSLSPKMAENTGSDNPAQASIGYCLFKRRHYLVYHQVYDHIRRLLYWPLRDAGYVFWDAARINTRDARESLEKANDASDWRIDSVSRRGRMSVEERLQGSRCQ